MNSLTHFIWWCRLIKQGPHLIISVSWPVCPSISTYPGLRPALYFDTMLPAGQNRRSDGVDVAATAGTLPALPMLDNMLNSSPSKSVDFPSWKGKMESCGTSVTTLRLKMFHWHFPILINICFTSWWTVCYRYRPSSCLPVVESELRDDVVLVRGRPALCCLLSVYLLTH